ncbi:MAG: inositol-3-phosphate synthase [Candidatus Bathyarchaeota archaeon]|nr:MAG: inositol-3-phosphate synthase [Candidatus Bathyarchaeota archaeon]
MGKIKVALVGVGNCASSFVQGLHYYRDSEGKKNVTGLKNLALAGYYPKDIEIVSAFDIDTRKVGKDLSEAIIAEPNNTKKFAKVPELGVPVQKGRVLDGVGNYLESVVEIDISQAVNVAQALKESDAEILVNLLPSGAENASHWYTEQALLADCAFINVTPTSIASDLAWDKRFRKAGLPVVGDDLIDQIGATTLHKTLLKLLSMQGVQISETYQLDVGGGTESLDTLERSREVKRVVKTKTVKSALPYQTSVVAGTTDYVDFLQNRRNSYLSIKGFYFGKTPMDIELRLCTVDGPNAGSVLFDVIRALKIAKKRGEAGTILGISAYAFKHPPKILPFETAVRLFEDFLK